MDCEDVIMELLSDSCSTPEFSATAADVGSFCESWSPISISNGHGGQLQQQCHQQHQGQASSSDDLNGLNTWDFAVMRSEFGDLQSFDSATLIDLYQPAPSDTAAAAAADTDDHDEALQRCRSDSGYSSTCGDTTGHGGPSSWWCGGCSPATSVDHAGGCGCSGGASCDLSWAPAPTSAKTPEFRRSGGRRAGGGSAKPAMVKKARSKPAKVRQLQLWQFLYQMLEQYAAAVSEENPAAALRWESRPEGSFRIVSPAALAEAWGRHRRRDNMTYEKMSRTLRYYYDRKLITKVAGKQHTYRFHYDQFPPVSN